MIMNNLFGVHYPTYGGKAYHIFLDIKIIMIQELDPTDFDMDFYKCQLRNGKIYTFRLLKKHFNEYICGDCYRVEICQRSSLGSFYGVKFLGNVDPNLDSYYLGEPQNTSLTLST